MAETGSTATIGAAASSYPPGWELPLEQICCPLCGSSNSHTILRVEDRLCGVPGEFGVDQCDDCGHRFMNPRPLLSRLADCYPPHYGPHRPMPPSADTGTGGSAERIEVAGSSASSDRKTNAVERPWYLRYLPLRKIPGLRSLYYGLMDDRSQPLPLPKFAEAEDTFAPRRAGSAEVSELPTERMNARTQSPQALELGCASGSYLQRLQQLGWEVTGVEPGAEPAAAARRAGLNVCCGTLETCPLPSGRFDLAAAWSVLEHVPDPRATLLQLHSLLKDGGQLLLSIPNAGCWERWFFGRYWYVWELPRHLQYFTPGSVRQLLAECGFTEIRIIHQRSLLNVVGSLGLACHSLFPRAGRRLGTFLRRYPDHPTLAGQLLLAPLAHGLAWMRQGGRLTISARRDSGSQGGGYR